MSEILMCQQKRMYHTHVNTGTRQEEYLQFPRKFRAAGWYLVTRKHSSFRWKKTSEELGHSFTTSTNDLAAELGQQLCQQKT